MQIIKRINAWFVKEYMEDFEKQLVAAWQEIQDEKLRWKMLQEILNGLKADGKMQTGHSK